MEAYRQGLSGEIEAARYCGGNFGNLGLGTVTHA